MMEEAPIELRKREEIALEALNNFAIVVLSTNNKPSLYQCTAHEAVASLGFDDCVVYELDPKSNELVQVSAINDKLNEYGKILNPLRIPLGTGITGTVAKTLKPEIVADLAQDNRYIPDLMPALSEICVPILVGERVVGVIDCESPKKNAFNEFQLKTLETIAAMVSGRLVLIEKAQQQAKLERKLYEAQKVEAMSSLVSTTAHDFNNHLSIIMNTLELIAAREPNLQKTLAPAIISVERAAEMVIRVTHITEAELGTAETLDVQKVLVEMKPVLTMLLRDGVTLEIQEKFEDLYAHFDKDGLENAIINLVKNAVEAIKGSALISVICKTVTPKTAPYLAEVIDAPHICIEVNDTGRGMDEATLANALAPMFSTKSSTELTRGFGLASVNGFAERNGGAVVIESELGGGTCVNLLLPLASAQPEIDDTKTSAIQTS